MRIKVGGNEAFVEQSKMRCWLSCQTATCFMRGGGGAVWDTFRGCCWSLHLHTVSISRWHRQDAVWFTIMVRVHHCRHACPVQGHDHHRRFACTVRACYWALYGCGYQKCAALLVQAAVSRWQWLVSYSAFWVP